VSVHQRDAAVAVDDVAAFPDPGRDRPLVPSATGQAPAVVRPRLQARGSRRRRPTTPEDVPE
jgi:hypothetical protein